jgi:hypothetical protein
MQVVGKGDVYTAHGPRSDYNIFPSSHLFFLSYLSYHLFNVLYRIGTYNLRRLSSLSSNLQYMGQGKYELLLSRMRSGGREIEIYLLFLLLFSLSSHIHPLSSLHPILPLSPVNLFLLFSVRDQVAFFARSPLLYSTSTSRLRD